MWKSSAATEGQVGAIAMTTHALCVWVVVVTCQKQATSHQTPLKLKIFKQTGNPKTVVINENEAKVFKNEKSLATLVVTHETCVRQAEGVKP
jgi:hypothetical protein